MRALPALAAGNFLIVNSDTTVEKYRASQAAFLETVGIPTREIDLGEGAAAERQLRTLVRDADPGVIYCVGTRAYMSALEVARGRKIVVSSALNWERLPVTRTTYGIASELSPTMQLTTIRYMFPNLHRLGILYSREFQSETVREAKVAAAQLGFELEFRSTQSQVDVERALRPLLESVDALWLIPDPVVLENLEAVHRIFEQCDRLKKPILAYESVYAREGAVLTVAPDVPTIGRQAARLAEQILGGQSIGRRFQAPAGSEVILNLRKVREYGLVIGDGALESVNRIIE